MDDLEQADSPPAQYPTDKGQIGAIIQTRLDGTNAHVWCRLGSLCFTRQKLPGDDTAPAYQDNGKGQRRRVDRDDNLMVVTPDFETLKELGPYEFVGVSLSDVPCSPRLESPVVKYPDACGRVAVQISGIATVPIPQSALGVIDKLRIGDPVSVDVDNTQAMEFSEHETTLLLKKSTKGDSAMHYIGIICNMNLSPVTGPSIDVLLCPQRYAKDMNKRSDEISKDAINSTFLDKAWGVFRSAANASDEANAFDTLKESVRKNLSSQAQIDELVTIIDDFKGSTDDDHECPDANEVSFFGKLVFFMGIPDGDDYLPGFSDALVPGTASFKQTVKAIKGNLSSDVHDTEASSIFCKTPKEVQWIKAWESWAQSSQLARGPTMDEKISALNECIKANGGS